MLKDLFGNKEWIDRFTQKVCKSEAGCWLWTAGICPNGYGMTFIRSKQIKTHRAAYLLFVGEIPDGMLVLHRCDVRHCVNPAHLYVGTHKQNMEDMKSRGRSLAGDRNPARMYPESRPRGDNNPSRKYIEKRPRGERHAQAKLTNEIVLEIRRMHKAGSGERAIALHFGIAKTTVRNVFTRRTWKHIEEVI